MANIWLLIIFFAPIILLILLRINAVYVYIGLCLGYVLSQFDGSNKIIATLAGSKVIEHIGGSNNIRLALLLLPPVILMIFMLKTASHSKFSINLLPAIAVGLLTIITVIPLLPLSTAVNIINSSLWQDVTKYEGTLVALSVLVILVLLIAQRTKLGSSKESKHHKSKG